MSDLRVDTAESSRRRARVVRSGGRRRRGSRRRVKLRRTRGDAKNQRLGRSPTARTGPWPLSNPHTGMPPPGSRFSFINPAHERARRIHGNVGEVKAPLCSGTWAPRETQPRHRHWPLLTSGSGSPKPTGNRPACPRVTSSHRTHAWYRSRIYDGTASSSSLRFMSAYLRAACARAQRRTRLRASC